MKLRDALLATAAFATPWVPTPPKRKVVEVLIGGDRVPFTEDGDGPIQVEIDGIPHFVQLRSPPLRTFSDRRNYQK